MSTSTYQVAYTAGELLAVALCLLVAWAAHRWLERQSWGCGDPGPAEGWDQDVPENEHTNEDKEF